MILYGLVHFGDDDRRRNLALDDHLGAARVAGTVEHLAIAADHGRRSAAVEIDRIDGTQLDYTREGIQEGFKFNNPNEKDPCGCGKSFSV